MVCIGFSFSLLGKVIFPAFSNGQRFRYSKSCVVNPMFHLIKFYYFLIARLCFNLTDFSLFVIQQVFCASDIDTGHSPIIIESDKKLDIVKFNSTKFKGWRFLDFANRIMLWQRFAFDQDFPSNQIALGKHPYPRGNVQRSRHSRNLANP